MCAHDKPASGPPAPTHIPTRRATGQRGDRRASTCFVIDVGLSQTHLLVQTTGASSCRPKLSLEENARRLQEQRAAPSRPPPLVRAWELPHAARTAVNSPAKAATSPPRAGKVPERCKQRHPHLRAPGATLSPGREEAVGTPPAHGRHRQPTEHIPNHFVTGQTPASPGAFQLLVPSLCSPSHSAQFPY